MVPNVDINMKTLQIFYVTFVLLVIAIFIILTILKNTFLPQEHADKHTKNCVNTRLALYCSSITVLIDIYFKRVRKRKKFSNNTIVNYWTVRIIRSLHSKLE